MPTQHPNPLRSALSGPTALARSVGRRALAAATG